MFKKEFILFEEAKKSKVLLNGLLSTVIMFLMIFIGQVMGGIFISIIIGMKHGVEGVRYGAEHLAEQLMEFSIGPIGLILTFIFPLLLCLLWVKVVEKRKIASLG